MPSIWSSLSVGAEAVWQHECRGRRRAQRGVGSSQSRGVECRAACAWDESKKVGGVVARAGVLGRRNLGLRAQGARFQARTRMRSRAAETRVLNLEAWAWAGSGWGANQVAGGRARGRLARSRIRAVLAWCGWCTRRAASREVGEERRRQGGRGNEALGESGGVVVLVEEIGPGAVKGGRAVVSAQRHHDGLRARSGERGSQRA